MEEGATARGSRYTLAQVMNATKKNTILLGKGGFGPVYYGKLPTGQEVAVKVSEKGSNQGSKEFINEVLIKLGLLTCCFQSRLPVDVTYSSLNC
jgi:hypothetical protein